MKIAVLLLENAKQIMITPESDHEREALKMIAPGDKIEAVTKWGRFADEEEMYGLDVSMAEGGYYRGYQSKESLMFLITGKKEKEKE